MLKLNDLAIVVAAIAAFVLSSLYYSPLLLGNVWRNVDPVARTVSPSAGRAFGEFVRTLVIAFVVAHLVSHLGARDWKSALGLAVWLWFGFSAMMWIGAIMWEKTPWQVAAIHSGDWLIKIALIAAVVGVWRG